MSTETQRLAPPRLAWWKALDPEKLLEWLAQTAEDVMGLSYELSKIRAPSED
jgi:hypothetical protein